MHGTGGQMLITFFSNYYNHHQAALCQALSGKEGVDFYFVETEPMESFRRDMGWGGEELPGFVISAWEDEEKRDMALDLAGRSDAVIIGSAPEWYVEKRIEQDRLVFRYTERPMKEGWIKMFIPRLARKFYRLHYRNRDRNVYLLGASAFAAYDYSLLRSYPGKCLKFGYFPQGEKLGFEELMKKKQGPVTILWTGRFLKLKRCELFVQALGELKRRGCDFRARIVGEGEREGEIRSLVDSLGIGGTVEISGFVKPEENRELMRRAHIYVMTSNFLEGWGSVIYEALSEGCAVVASHACGCTNWLVSPERTGLVFRNGSRKSLVDKLERFIRDEELRYSCQKGAYEQMKELWNPDRAAERIVEAAGSLLEGRGLPDYEDGPLSRADIVKNNWYREPAGV